MKPTESVLERSQLTRTLVPMPSESLAVLVSAAAAAAALCFFGLVLARFARSLFDQLGTTCVRVLVWSCRSGSLVCDLVR